MDIIDIGSNSVRLLSNGKKTVITTRLAQNMLEGKLDKDSMLRTAEALKTLCEKAHGNPFAFATEAVRKAENKDEFLRLVNKIAGLKVDIISGDEEAEISYLGAACGYDGSGVVIDLGGASCETVWGKFDEILYKQSFPFGCVMLKDKFGDDLIGLERFVRATYTIPEIKAQKYFAVGGTVTSLAAMDMRLNVYDPDKIDGHDLYLYEITQIIGEVKRGKNFPTLRSERRETIIQGAAALRAVMGKLNIRMITVKETDNLEGYMIKHNLM